MSVTIAQLDYIITRRIPWSKSQTLDYVVRKNIEYNIQYLEFLCEHIASQTAVLQSIIVKNFLIVAFSIMEGVLSYELKKQKLVPLDEWENISSIKANPKKVLETFLKTETIVYQKMSVPKEKSLTFKQKTDIAQNHKIFGNNPKVYKELCRLNKLRNKVHLHTMDELQETDYNRFSNKEFQNIKAFFLQFLHYYFKITVEEEQKYFSFLVR